jgi:hypothetical protein
MTDEKSPLVLDFDGWVRLGVDVPRDQLVQLGPVIPVSIEPSPAKPGNVTNNRFLGVPALIDTGASTSCIAPRLAQNLGVQPSQMKPIDVANRGTQVVPVYRYAITFPSGTQIDADFGILAHLKRP